MSNDTTKTIKDFAIIAAVLYGLYTIKDIFGHTPTPELPDGFTPDNRATINITTGYLIAKKIKDAFGYVYNDIVAIDKAMQQLQNRYDVEILYFCFGIFDGPLDTNGNLFDCLNLLPITSGVTVHNGSTANFESIRAHLYEYGSEVNF